MPRSRSKLAAISSSGAGQLQRVASSRAITAAATDFFQNLLKPISTSKPDCMTGSANPNNIRKWGQWAAEPIDQELLAEVLAIFAPVKNLGHLEGLPENN